MTRRTLVLAWMLSLGLSPAAYGATSVLMLLEHVDQGKTVQTKIELKNGVVESKDKGKPREKWILRSGDALSAVGRPDDRVVRFFKTTGGDSVLLFIVKARYFPTTNGKWIPQFQLNEEPLVVRGPGGRWQPLTTVQGVPSLIVQTGTELPNAEGYKNSIELGFTTGPMPIDAWLVQ